MLGTHSAGMDDHEEHAGSGPEELEQQGFTVDPTQSEQERRDIRHKFRDLMARMEANKHELAQPGNRDLKRLLVEGNETFSRVRNPREAYFDSMMLAQAATLGAQQAQRLRTTVLAFDPGLLVTRLKALASSTNLQDEDEASMGPDTWALLGRTGLPCMPGRAPTVSFMLGPIAYERQVVHRQRQARQPDDKTGPMKEPDNVTNQYAGTEEATSKEVHRIAQYVNKLQEPMGLFEFVVNPGSFSATVENIFHLAFLVKDGWAAITLDPNGLPLIASDEPASEESGGDSGAKNQLVLDMAMSDWRAIVHEFGITRSHIPLRTEDPGSDLEEEQEEEQPQKRGRR